MSSVGMKFNKKHAEEAGKVKKGGEEAERFPKKISRIRKCGVLWENWTLGGNEVEDLWSCFLGDWSSCGS